MFCKYCAHIMSRCFCAAVAPRQWRSPRRGARRAGEPTPLQLNIELFCEAAALRQERSPRRGARRVGGITYLQLHIYYMIYNTSVQVQFSCASSMIFLYFYDIIKYRCNLHGMMIFHLFILI